MKAVLKTQNGPGNVVYTEVPHPGRPGPGMILVEVKTVGICGSDLHMFHGNFPLCAPPVILGHEYIGVAVEVGEGVSAIKPGDKVSSEVPTECCGTCMYCQTGEIQHCVNRKGMGANRDGCFAKYAMVQEAVTHKLPDDMDLRLGALLEPVATCSHCMDLTGVQAHETVVVAGPGPIGLIMMQLVKAEGARVLVTGTDVDEARLRLALELGADGVINVQREDGLARIRALTGGYGADAYIECSGSAPSIGMGIEALRHMGKYTQMGVVGSVPPIAIDRIARKELRFTGVCCENWASWDHAIKLVARGKIDLEKMATHEFGFDEWEKAFETFENKSGLKILMHPVE